MVYYQNVITFNKCQNSNKKNIHPILAGVTSQGKIKCILSSSTFVHMKEQLSVQFRHIVNLTLEAKYIGWISHFQGFDKSIISSVYVH